MKVKKIFTIIALLVLFKDLTWAKSKVEYPPYYTPQDQNLRKITAYPAPLLSIEGEYGIWFKTGIKNTIEENKITRPFIICEGFDVANNLEFDDLFEQLNQNSFIERDNKRSVSKIKTINNLL